MLDTSSIIAKTVSLTWEHFLKTSLRGAIFPSYCYGTVPANATFPEPITLGLTILFLVKTSLPNQEQLGQTLDSDFLVHPIDLDLGLKKEEYGPSTR